MKTRCKFKCDEITEIVSKNWDGEKYIPFRYFGAKFSAVIGDNEENKKFFASSPSGHFEIMCITQRFEPGKEYYIDIEEAN